MAVYSGYDLNVIRNPQIRRLFEQILDVAAGHDHDGSNSKSVSAGTVADNSITNAKINAAAAIAYSKLNLTGSIVNADINAAAAIAWSKMAVSTDISSTGTVTDFTIASEAQGDVLYFNGTNWVRLAAGVAGQALLTNGAAANPSWGAPTVASATAVANNLTAEAGANDYTIDFGTAGGAYTLTIPAVGGARTFSFINEAETISANKTFGQTNLLLQGGDANACNIKINETLTGAKTLNIKINDTDRTIDLGGNLTLAGSWTHSGAHTVGITTQNNGTFAFADATAYALTFPTGTDTLVGRASTDTLTNKTITGNVAASLLYSAGGNAITFQDAVHTVVGRDTTDTLTNKSIDANGTGNVITNINGDELDSITGNTYGIPVIIKYTLSNQAAAVDIFNANAPFKFKVIKAWSISTSADGGTWKLNNGAGGGGTDITNAVTVAANADDFDEPTDYVDAQSTINSSGSLSIVPDGGGALDAEIYVQILRVD